MEAAFKLVSAAAKAKGLRLETKLALDLPPVVVGDQTRLSQILVNLLSNAVKFTRQGRVGIEAFALGRPDGCIELQFAVRDTGIGIAPERMSRLFREFSQAEASTTRQYGGTGLGLAISKRLVELHGGRIWAESTPGVGSTFHFTFVTKAITPGRTPAAPAVTAAGFDATFASRHPHRLLVVEDNPVNQKVAAQMLRRLGYEAAIAGHGREALDLLRRGNFDLVLMDVEMPEMDGLEATAQIRRELSPEAQPIIVAVTAHALTGDRPRFLAAGMDDALTKPLRLAELQRVLAERARPPT